MNGDETSRPQRIQLSRRKGWRMPENTIKVDRTTRWGNPYLGGRDGDGNRSHLVELFRVYLECHPEGWQLAMDARAELHGRNLACWCPLPAPGERDVCHAAVLLEIANS